MKTLVIIPALNEEHAIGGVIDDLRRHFSDADILVINDGSKDGTAQVAAEKGVMVVSLPFNLGIGAAMQTGYRFALRNGYERALQFDGDGQHRADQIAELIKQLAADEADIIIGSRFLLKGSYEVEKMRSIGIKTLSKVISMLVSRPITDPTSGFRMVNRKVIEFYDDHYPDDYPEAEAVVLLHRAGFRIREVPVLMEKRMMGSSSITFVRGVYYMVKVLLAIFIDMMKKL